MFEYFCLASKLKIKRSFLYLYSKQRSLKIFWDFAPEEEGGGGGGGVGSKMLVVNSFVDHLVEDNFPKLKNWTHVKCNPVIQFKEFSKMSEKIELHDVRWKYILQNN